MGDDVHERMPRDLEAWERERFDALVEEAIEQLPPTFSDFIAHTPVVVDDLPTMAMLIGIEGDEPIEPDELCGLHVGIANPDRGEAAGVVLPSQIHLFRVGILRLVGGWTGDGVEDDVYGEIMVTLLHEIGHQIGLEEDDLEALGYA